MPRKNVDTGAGYERLLSILQDTDSVFDTDLFAPIVDAAKVAVRGPFTSEEHEVSARIVADHARTMTFLVNDGVVPSNEDRGYVLRRIIRRAVRHAYRLGAEGGVTGRMVDATVDAMGAAYPDLVK